LTNPQASSIGNTYVPHYTNYQLEEEELRLQLTRRDNQIAISLNDKENGIVEIIETQNGQQWFGDTGIQQQKRFAFRKAFSFGAIPAGTPLTVTHGISGATIFVHIYGGVITSNPDFRPLPHASVTANANIEVIVTSTNYTINNGAGGPNITFGVLVLEYLKQ
jgi:hypothetical protein